MTGRVIDRLPWFLRRLYIAKVTREWPWNVPDEARLIGFRRPPEHVFDCFRELHRDDIARASHSQKEASDA